MEFESRARRLWRNEPGLASGRREDLRFARCRSRRSRFRPRRGPRGGIRSEGRRHRQRRRPPDRREPARTSCSMSSCRQRGMASSRQASRRAATCSAKSRWRETLDEARDLVARAKAAGRIHAVVQNRRYLASVRRIARALQRRRDRRDHQRSRRFLPCSAFRRLSRGDGPCSAARHGDPQIRRHALHDRPGRRRASIAANGTRHTPGTGRARRRPRSSNSRTAHLHLSRQLVRRRAWHQSGNAPGASSARKAR